MEVGTHKGCAKKGRHQLRIGHIGDHKAGQVRIGHQEVEVPAHQSDHQLSDVGVVGGTNNAIIKNPKQQTT